MLALIKNIWNDESGQGLPEYALLVAAVVVMVVTAAYLFEDVLVNLFQDIGTYIDGNKKV